MKKIPPLNSLRAFYMVSKHQSISKASQEMLVTPAAVSHQIKQLEEITGRRLFKRLPRGVELTAEGKRLIFDVQKAFEALEGLTDKIWRPSAQAKLKMTTVPSFASCVMMPALQEFRTRYPNISLQIDVNQQISDITAEKYELAIRYGRGNWPNLRSERLRGSELILVAAPEIVAKREFVRVEDLMSMTLISDPGSVNVTEWFNKVLATTLVPASNLVIDDFGVGVQAAREGHGLMLTHRILVENDLGSGRLVQPVQGMMESETAYFLVHDRRNELSEAAHVFWDWATQMWMMG